MWYEILPPLMIMTGLMCTPQIAGWYLAKGLFGNGYRRELYNVFDFWMFTRDTRIDGAPWNVRGLENIPDEV